MTDFKLRLTTEADPQKGVITVSVEASLDGVMTSNSQNFDALVDKDVLGFVISEATSNMAYAAYTSLAREVEDGDG